MALRGSAARDWATEVLATRHDRTSFSSGIPELDAYLRQQARQDMRRRSAVPYVLCEADTVVGYYTISSDSADLGSLPEETARRLPRYPRVPAILIGRLAIDERHRGRGLGRVLLADALRRACDVSESIGAAMVVVEAKNDAATAFYRHYGFQPFPDHPHHLFLSMHVVAQMEE